MADSIVIIAPRRSSDRPSDDFRSGKQVADPFRRTGTVDGGGGIRAFLSASICSAPSPTARGDP